MAIPGPFNPGGTAASLADAIRAQAAAQTKRATGRSGLVDTSQVNTPDPFSQLLQQIQSIRVEPTPYDQLLRMATGQAGAQFDPLIRELEGQISATTKRGKANQKEARQMYNALARDIAAQMPEITNQMAQASREAEQRYNDTQAALQNEYNKQAEAQAALFKKLGIQAAAPEASQQAMEDQTYFQNQIRSDKAAALQLLDEMENADVSYNRETANNTRLAGENTAQEIAAQLEDYLQQANSKLGGLRAGRQSAIQAMLAQLQQQDQERIARQEQQEYDRLMDLFNLQMKMQQMQQDALNKRLQNQGLFKGTNGPSGAANYLSEVYGGDTFTPTAIMDAINAVMENPAVVAGEYDTGRKDMYNQPIMNKVTDEYLRQLLIQQLNQQGGAGPLSATQFSNADINNAINALMAYRGRLK